MNGNFTDLDRRCFGAAHNAIRLALREIGLKPTAQANQPLDLSTYLASLPATDGVVGEAATPPSAPRPNVRRPTG